MEKVFLGGTCNNSTWRDELVSLLQIEYFNPVVPNWTPEDQVKEIDARETSDFVLYVLTARMASSPQLGYYSIAEVVDDANRRPHKTILCILYQDGDFCFTPDQVRALEAVRKLVGGHGVRIFATLKDVARYLNDEAERGYAPRYPWHPTESDYRP